MPSCTAPSYIPLGGNLKKHKIKSMVDKQLPRKINHLSTAILLQSQNVFHRHIDILIFDILVEIFYLIY